MKMTPRSIMFLNDTWKKLQELAHIESLRSGKEVTASSLVREAVERQLRGSVMKENKPARGTDIT